VTGQAPVTVVIPTLDEEALLAGCLASVGRHPGVEVVVSDGGSRDATVAIAADHRVKVVEGPTGRGPQLNLGATATDTPILLFLHADCRLPSGWLPAVRTALADPSTALACFRLRTQSARGDGAGVLRTAWLRLLDLRSLGLGLPYGDQAFAVRRDVFDRLGGFADIPLMEDLELARHARRVGRIVRLPLEVATSARRFERHPLRARVMTTTLPVLYRVGVSPERLARWYKVVR
jgi:rSAM/selenodomain-associated transferase 2